MTGVVTKVCTSTNPHKLCVHHQHHGANATDRRFYMVLCNGDCEQSAEAAMPVARRAATTTGTLSTMPEITLLNGWLYVVGDTPRIGTSTVIAQAEGTSFILQVDPADAPGCDRTIVLDAGLSDAGLPLAVVVHSRATNSVPTAQPTAGCFVDFNRATGVWSNPTPNSNNPVVQTVITTVAIARDANDVP